MKRKNGTSLVKNEELLLVAALSLHNSGVPDFHGYRVNEFLEENGRRMVASTLYRILKRLEERGLLESRWEQAPNTDQWRCLFTLTGTGVAVATEVANRPATPTLSNPAQT